MFLEDDRPIFISNAEFTGYEEEDIDRITEREHAKLRQSPRLPGLRAKIEEQLGPGNWEQHWVTVDEGGDRVFAEVFFADHQTAAITATGEIVRAFRF